VLAGAAEAGLLAAAHDLSDGGLAVALAECCLAGTVGCRITLPASLDAFTSLFSESAGRVAVAAQPGAEDKVRALCAEHQVPVAELGRTGGDTLTVSGQFRIPLAELAAVHRGPLPSLFS
jgi:phosphoribosylformylglycinamidine (FGAM) synthase-like enzyme